MPGRQVLCNSGYRFRQLTVPVRARVRLGGGSHFRLAVQESDTHLKANELSKRLSVLITLFMFATSSHIAVAGSGSPFPKSLSADLAETRGFYETGMRLIQQKHVAAAIETFKRGLGRDSRNVVLLNAIGAAYSLENHAQTGNRYFLAALNIDPQFAPARRNLAISYFKRGSFDLATGQFKLLWQNQENRPVASLFLGMLAVNRGEYSQGIKFFDESGSLLYQYPDSILCFARALYQSRRQIESRRVLNRLRDVSAASPDNWFQAGMLYADLGQRQQARDAFREALHKNPQAPEIDYHEALALSKLDRSDDALEVLQKLTAQDPDSDLLNLLGRAAEQAGNVWVSVHAFRKAVELAPDAEGNYLDFSTLCISYGNNAAALEIVRAGLAHLPESYRLRVQEGAVLSNLGKQQEAEEAFRSAITLRSDNQEAFLGLAVAQTLADQSDDAIKTLTTGVERFPKDFEFHYYYSRALLAEAEHSRIKGQAARKIRQTIEETIQLNPGSARAYYLLAKFYLNEGNLRLAEANLETCLRLNPEYVSAKYELGLTYLKTGRRQSGERLLREIRREHVQELRREGTRPRIVLAER